MVLRQLDLFAGIGGFSLAASWFGIQTTQFVEIDPYCQRVLQKNFPGVPIYDDVTTFVPTLGQFDIITAGFPCQDLSSANPNGRGLEGKRSGLFFEVVRILRAVQPRFVLLENVPNLLNRGLDRVLWELAQSGFDAEWQIVSAASMGAPHQRERIFVIAYSTGTGTSTDNPRLWTGIKRIGGRLSPITPNPQGNGRRSGQSGDDYQVQQQDGAESFEVGCGESATRPQPNQGTVKPGVCGMDDGLSPWLDGHHPAPISHGSPYRNQRLKALGNSVVPQCAAIAYQRILEINQCLTTPPNPPQSLAQPVQAKP